MTNPMPNTITNIPKRSTRAEKISALDAAHVWHPYSSFKPPIAPLPVARAEGVEIFLQDGRSLIDGMASWWSAIHGYNHPTLNQALSDQSQRMSHVMFGGLTHEPAVALVKKLVDITPPPLNKVFLADSGSVAVEVALKMAIQYWASLGKPEKCRSATVRNGYHGDTFAAMSVCDPINGMHELFSRALPKAHFLPAPKLGFEEPVDEAYLSEMQTFFAQHHTELSAFIIEPIVQGTGGMRIYNPQYLQILRKLCDEYEVLLIFDEIATGFGRTGKLFATNHTNIIPDILTLGKAMSGGYLSLAATLTTDKISDGISQGIAPALMHGPTFMGNPLACNIALASIELLLDGPWQERVQRIENTLSKELTPLTALPQVADVRCIGAIAAIEMKQPVDITKAQPIFTELGVWLRPFGKLIYCMPPYIISDSQLLSLTAAMKATAEALTLE
jgi:adenosylmethionine-8-amino-7-oxononanoate aminotransferase